MEATHLPLLKIPCPLKPERKHKVYNLRGNHVLLDTMSAAVTEFARQAFF